MQKLSLATLVLLSASSMAFAAGENVEGFTTNGAIIKTAKSVYTGPTHGAANEPGLGVYSIGGGAAINAHVLYDTLRTSVDSNGIATIGGSAHPGMGTWALGRATGSDSNRVYYGVWQGPSPSNSAVTSYVAYVVGDNVTRSLNNVKGNSYNYSTHGVGQGNEFFTGTLTANFNAAGTGGTVTGNIASASRTITLDSSTSIFLTGSGSTSVARFAGSANSFTYAIDGLFYGASAQTLAGTAAHVSDTSKSVGFAGTR